MENKISQTTIILIIVGLIVGTGIGYTLAPKQTGGAGDEPGTVTITQNPLEGKKIQLGVIAPGPASMETEQPLYEEIVTPMVNDYTSTLGYDVEFEYLIDQGEYQAAAHLEKVQSFKSMGINLFLGGPFSSMAQAALSYVNENDMIMVSPMSTSPLLAISDDNLFRMCPTDYVQAPAITEMLETWGIEAIVVLQRGDAWGDGIYNLLEKEWTSRGHVILDRVRYAVESTEFSNYLQTIDDIIAEAKNEYGYERIAVQTMAIDELVVIVSQTEDFPNARNVIWMGCEGAGRNTRMIDDASETCVDLRIFSSTMVPTASWKWEQFEQEYFDVTGTYAAFYTGTGVDGSTLLARNVLETGDTDASVISNHFLKSARSYFGVTGWIDLDENGDRSPGMFEIFGYAEVDGEVTFKKFGEYNGVTLQVTWNEDLIDQQGIDKPGSR